MEPLFTFPQPVLTKQFAVLPIGFISMRRIGDVSDVLKNPGCILCLCCIFIKIRVLSGFFCYSDNSRYVLPSAFAFITPSITPCQWKSRWILWGAPYHTYTGHWCLGVNVSWSMMPRRGCHFCLDSFLMPWVTHA